MTRTPRDLIALSDGTGNSASSPFKTNVWRLYQALRLGDGSQVAVFGDGVGNSSVKFLRVLGLALGIGVKRNVLNLYKFLCHNYREADPEKKIEADRIWMFGFSRGAFTVRVLAGLIDSQGLVTFTTESELKQNAIAAYRAYRQDAFKTKIPWVRAGRSLRDKWIRIWRGLTGGKQYSEFKRRPARIHFIGVWDTVAAYGLPIDELTIAVDKWVWPMKFDSNALRGCVDNARHACALDDERRTFHPIPWSESDEKAIQQKQEEREKRGEPRTVPANRLLQVWFPGVHSDVGGGYPDDGLSLVPLCWMIDEAEAKGLRFEKIIVELYRAQASPTGRLYDSRAGGGVLWRYQPRNVQLLMDDRRDHLSPADMITPLVHHSAVIRMTYGNDGYAPKSLPLQLEILLPDAVGVPVDKDAVVAFDKNAVDAALQKVTDRHRKIVLEDLAVLLDRKDKKNRADYFDLVLDTVWWRRCVYFTTLFLVLVGLSFPLIYEYLVTSDKPEKVNEITGGALTYVAGLFKGLLPSFATPWIDAVTRNGPAAIAIVLAFVLSLALSTFLQNRIHDRARGAWNVQPETGGGRVNRLKPTGQRRGLAVMTFLFLGAALATLTVIHKHPDWFFFFLIVAVVFAIGWGYRLKRPEGDVDPSKPRRWLWLSRALRKNPALVRRYRWVAQTGAPIVAIGLAGWITLSGLNLGLFNLQSTAGKFCKDVSVSEPIQKLIDTGSYEELKPTPTIDLKSLCAPTGIWLIAGRQYRIRIEPQTAWFDHGIPADVSGFSTDNFLQGTAITLKRWWREDWFQPIARVGNIGNYEYPLRPAAPLPEVDFSACRSVKGVEDQLKCEEEKKIVRNKVLISDITPNSTGQLYIYVNDAVLAIPGLHSIFYDNNIGTMKVTVTRTVAPATVDATQ